MKKGVGSGVGSGSTCQKYGSGDLDPGDQHQNVTNPQHCLILLEEIILVPHWRDHHVPPPPL
jgi:hypothetical protein